MIDLAGKNLFHDKLRFFITVAGVAFAVMLVLVQTGLFIGILSNASVTIDKLDADLWVTARNTPNVDFAHPFSESLVERVRSVPGVLRADNLTVSFADIALPSGAQETAEIYAMENFAPWGFPWDVRAGNVEDLRRGKNIFMDESATRRYGKFAVNEYREFAGTRLKIIGRTHDARSFTTTPLLFADMRTSQALSFGRLDGSTTYIVVKLAAGSDRQQVLGALRARLPNNDVYTREAWAKRSRDYWVDSTGIGFNMYITVFLGGLVGVVVVAQTLYASTMEHIKEYGTVKAIGGDNALIYRIIGKQALIAAVVGYVLGLVPSFAMIPLVALVDLKLTIPPQLFIAVFVGTVLMCLAAAAISFRKVAAIDPALVFRA